MTTEEHPQFSPSNVQIDPEHEEASPTPKRWLWILITSFQLLLVLVFSTYLHLSNLNQAPEQFPVNKAVTIEQGTDVQEITKILEQEGVVQSDTLLYYILVFFYDPTDIKASTYVFSEPLSSFQVAKRLTEGDFDTNLVTLTHIEGERVSKLAERAATSLPQFDAETFILLAESQEGKLFPETYFIPADYTAKELFDLMLATFEEKIAPLEQQIADHILSLDEILVLASIIEREANDEESKKLVSSVLQNRLQTGMPLQADASIEYVLDKPLAELTPDDLKIDSAYNTYLNKGLPPTPIGNPGLETIMAVLEPAESEFYYYITDDEGIFHYAETYREHLINIERYLR